MVIYTPKTENVRLGYSYSAALPKGKRHHPPLLAEFDRWFAEEIRKAKEDAWEEGTDSTFYNPEIRGYIDCPEENPYRKVQS